MYCPSTNNSEGVKLSPNMLSKHQHFWGSLLMYCQSTTLMHLKSHINRCCWVSPNMLSKAPLILRELHLSVSPNVPIPGTNTYWGSHINRFCQVSPNMLFKAPLILRELHLSVSPNVPIPGTNTYWGSHVILAARCSPNVLSKYQHFLRESLVGCLQLYCQSTNVLLREFYLFAVKPVSSSSCLLSHFSFHLRLYKC